MRDVLPVVPEHSGAWFAAAAAVAAARIAPISGKRFTYPARWRTGRRTMGADILLLPETGRLRAWVDGRHHRASPGEALWLPRERLQDIAAEDGPVVFLSLHLRLDDDAGLPLAPHATAGPAGDGVHAWAVEGCARIERERAPAEAVLAQTARRQWQGWLERLEIAPDAVLPRELRTALRAATADPALGPSELARKVGCSPVTLRRRFVDHLGTTPARWLATRRLQRAAELLRSTPLPLSELATTAGFSDDRYLHQCFKARYGCTPETYRRGGP